MGDSKRYHLVWGNKRKFASLWINFDELTHLSCFLI